MDIWKGTLLLSGRDALDVYFYNGPGRRASCFTLRLNPLQNLPLISRYEFLSHVGDMTAIKLHLPRLGGVPSLDSIPRKPSISAV